jgi:hypothetical protein
MWLVARIGSRFWAVGWRSGVVGIAGGHQCKSRGSLVVCGRKSIPALQTTMSSLEVRLKSSSAAFFASTMSPKSHGINSARCSLSSSLIPLVSAHSRRAFSNFEAVRART